MYELQLRCSWNCLAEFESKFLCYVEKIEAEPAICASCDPKPTSCAVMMYILHYYILLLPSSSGPSVSASGLEENVSDDALSASSVNSFQNYASTDFPPTGAAHGLGAGHPRGERGEGHHRHQQALHHAQQPDRGQVSLSCNSNF